MLLNKFWKKTFAIDAIIKKIKTFINWETLKEYYSNIENIKSIRNNYVIIKEILFKIIGNFQKKSFPKDSYFYKIGKTKILINVIILLRFLFFS